MQFIPADLGAREQKSTTYVCVSFEVRYPSLPSVKVTHLLSPSSLLSGAHRRVWARGDEVAFLLQSSLGSLQHVSTEGTSSSRQCRT